MDEIWDAKRKHLEKEVTRLSLDLTEHMGCASFMLKVPGSDLLVAFGDLGEIRRLVETHNHGSQTADTLHPKIRSSTN
jgi:hypothetical protein